MENFFTPLGKEYCDYFYITMVISFVILVVSVLSSIYLVFTGELPIVGGILGLATPALLYLNNRLLFSMCVKSL